MTQLLYFRYHVANKLAYQTAQMAVGIKCSGSSIISEYFRMLWHIQVSYPNQYWLTLDGTLGTQFSKIKSKYLHQNTKIIHAQEMSSIWRPSDSGLNVLNYCLSVPFFWELNIQLMISRVDFLQLCQRLLLITDIIFVTCVSIESWCVLRILPR